MLCPGHNHFHFLVIYLDLISEFMNCIKKKKKTLNQPVISPTCNIGKPKWQNQLCCQTQKTFPERYIRQPQKAKHFILKTSVWCAETSHSRYSKNIFIYNLQPCGNFFLYNSFYCTKSFCLVHIPQKLHIKLCVGIWKYKYKNVFSNKRTRGPAPSSHLVEISKLQQKKSLMAAASSLDRWVPL